jgi:hypothetical protein
MAIPTKLLKAGANVEERIFIDKEVLPIPPAATKYSLMKGEDESRFLENLDMTIGHYNQQIKDFNQEIEQENIVESEWSPRHMLSNQDYKGETILHIVAQESLVEAAKLLVEHGVDVNAENGYWQTPLHVSLNASSDSRWKKVEELTSYLVGQGANVNAIDLNDYAAAVRLKSSSFIFEYQSRKCSVNPSLSMFILSCRSK